MVIPEITVAMSEEDVINGLSLKELKQPYHIQKSCARTGEGLIDGFRWISKNCIN